MNTYGLIGKSLKHSFSQLFFEAKFKKEALTDCQYRLFELPDIADLAQLLASEPDMCGFNVTIPYKKSILPYLDELSPEAAAIGAVNVVKRVKEVQGVNEVQEVHGVKLVKEEKRVRGVWLKGYNTDAEGFALSLEGVELPERALVLGTGGAASAVSFVLRQRGIPFLQVSRTSGRGDLTYGEVTEEVLREYRFIINCTPVGTLGEQQRLLPLPYEALTAAHFLYDLVYNPEVTPFLEKGKQYGARTQNGLRMLHLQAEAAWRIWRNLEK